MGLLDRRAHAGERAEVHDDVEAVVGEEPLHQLGVEEVAFVELDAIGHEREVAPVQRGRIERFIEVVEADDDVAARLGARPDVSR